MPGLSCIPYDTRALYFDNAPGFGEWRLLISGRAEHDLRQHRNEDELVYKIVIKKLLWVFLADAFLTLIVTNILILGNFPKDSSLLTTRK